MGLFLAYTSFIAIVAKYGKHGLTKEEILRINNDTYKTNLENYFGLVSSEGFVLTQNYIEARDGKYFLKKDCNLSSSWLETQIKRLEARKKI